MLLYKDGERGKLQTESTKGKVPSKKKRRAPVKKRALFGGNPGAGKPEDREKTPGVSL